MGSPRLHLGVGEVQNHQLHTKKVSDSGRTIAERGPLVHLVYGGGLGGDRPPPRYEYHCMQVHSIVRDTRAPHRHAGKLIIVDLHSCECVHDSIGLCL